MHSYAFKIEFLDTLSFGLRSRPTAQLIGLIFNKLLLFEFTGVDRGFRNNFIRWPAVSVRLLYYTLAEIISLHEKNLFRVVKRSALNKLGPAIAASKSY